MEQIKLPPDIDEYAEVVDHNLSCKVAQELILKIKSKTGLDLDVIEIVVSKIFQTIRTNLLQGNKIYLSELGSLKLNKLKAKNNKKKLQWKCSPTSATLELINGPKRD